MKVTKFNIETCIWFVFNIITLLCCKFTKYQETPIEQRSSFFEKILNILNARENSQLRRKLPTQEKITSLGENYQFRRKILVKGNKNKSDTEKCLLTNIPQNSPLYITWKHVKTISVIYTKKFWVFFVNNLDSFKIIFKITWL